MAISPGSRLGTYEILGPLGAGGMGAVYRAKDLRLGRQVAIKVLPEPVASSPARLARFEREARTVAGLNHPNIVTLHSVEDEDGVRFLTMELVEGRTLSSLVAPGGLPLGQLLALAIPLADALVATHERGVIHRDLKPGNVMVTHEGRVKVLDFGLAKAFDREVSEAAETLTAVEETPLSSPGSAMGTVPYMAPEQIRSDIVDARTDLFALGIILYELATGRRPFTGRTSADTTSSILRDTPEPVTRIRPDLPSDFEGLVTRCLEKNPRDRIQTALDVWNELRRLQRAAQHWVPDGAVRQRIASIAVLPFVNRGRDEEDEYFSDGLADELIDVLSKIGDLRVSARASSFHFKDKDVPIGEIGKSLNVATVLHGTVRKAGRRIRVSVQLASTADGYHLWSETYDRTLEDIFAVQDDIAQCVVRELRSKLLGKQLNSHMSGEVASDVAQAVRGRGTDPEAHRLYMVARHLLGRNTRDDTAKAIEYLNQSLARDPAFALGWSQLAGAYSDEANHGWTPMTEAYRRAREATERALSLQPDLAEGHARRGRIQMLFDGDWRGAEASYRRALELAPGNAVVLRGAGLLARSLGRLEEAIDLHQKAVLGDPLSAITYNNLGVALHAADHPTEAETAYRRALELTPKRGVTRALLALALLAEGRGEEALAEAREEPIEEYRLYALAIVHHALGHEAESVEAHRRLIDGHAGLMALQVAEVFAVRGETDAAFAWLERAYAQRDGGLTEIMTGPSFRSLHGDPRWRPYVRKVGLEW
jgi:serine/threonine protein kinase/predicted Zn-dependent protease